MKNLKYEFSEVEIDLIKKFIEDNEADFHNFKIDLRENITVKGESVSAAIRVANFEGQRCIYVCIRKFETYFDEYCKEPHELQRALKI
tara:strand:- start:46 stop:309 length:264 start_codon:yes stop_codon:yes gene_type:complete